MHADRSSPAAVAVDDGTGLDQVAENLPYEERVAFGLPSEGMGELDGVLVEIVTAGLGEELADPLLIDPAERESFDAGFSTEVADRRGQRVRSVDVGVAIGHEDHQCGFVGQLPDDVA